MMVIGLALRLEGLRRNFISLVGAAATWPLAVNVKLYLVCVHERPTANAGGGMLCLTRFARQLGGGGGAPTGMP